MATIISIIINLLVVILRLIVPIKEKKHKDEIVGLNYRIEKLKSLPILEMAKETKELELEVNRKESKLRGYPNTITALNILSVVTTVITLMVACIDYNKIN